METKQSFTLADGTMSSDYKVGDKFVVQKGAPTAEAGAIVTLVREDGSFCPFFKGGGIYEEPAIAWTHLKAKRFTKSDLQNGMRLINREGNTRYFINGKLFETKGSHFIEHWSNMNDFYEDLLVCGDSNFDIMRVIDRDGTILFTRNEQTQQQLEHAKLMQQIEELKAQAAKLEQ